PPTIVAVVSMLTTDDRGRGHINHHVDTRRVVFLRAGCWSRCQTNVVLRHVLGGAALWQPIVSPDRSLLVRTESNVACPPPVVDFPSLTPTNTPQGFSLFVREVHSLYPLSYFNFMVQCAE
ncbi:hypothetical protein AVEN_75647-1, partial [Araneus ventricosus]